MVELGKGVKTYFVLATIALAWVIYYEYKKQKDFYNLMITIQTKPLDVLVLWNFGLILTDVAVLIFLKIFFGELRSVEISYLYDQFVKNLINIIIIFYFLHIELTDKMSIMFIIYPTIMFLVHKLAHKRLEFLASTRNRDYIGYTKLGILLIFLFCIDIVSLRFLYPGVMKSDRKEVKNVDILCIYTFAEVSKMIAYLSIAFIRYLVNLFEIITSIEFENKETFFKVILLLISILCFGVDTLMIYLISNNGRMIPYFLIGNILNDIFEIYSNIKHLYFGIIQIKKINNIMEVTRKEMEEEELDHTCIICLNEMESGKLLEWKHVFHLKWLKKWIMHTSSWPSCKREDVIFCGWS